MDVFERPRVVISRPFALGNCNTSIRSSGFHASSIHNHSLKYQGDESRREKKLSIIASKQQISWHVVTSLRTV